MKDTQYINLKFDADLNLIDVEHVYKDKEGKEKKVKEKQRNKFNVDLDKVLETAEVSLIKGDKAGKDPYYVIYNGRLYCFP
jgi:hypothetical protein